MGDLRGGGKERGNLGGGKGKGGEGEEKIMVDGEERRIGALWCVGMRV